jgi:hypothetical protein
VTFTADQVIRGQTGDGIAPMEPHGIRCRSAARPPTSRTHSENVARLEERDPAWRERFRLVYGGVIRDLSNPTVIVEGEVEANKEGAVANA